MSSRLVLALLSVLLLWAQADWTAGTWKGANLQVTMQAPKAGTVAGTIVFGGQNLPFTAQAAGEKLEGTFTVEGNKFAFTITKAGGGHLTLTSDGTQYLLAPETAAAPAKKNPLAGGTPDSPATTAPATVVGEWQGPQGPVRFNADGTMIIAGQNYRYSIDGKTITLIAQDGQVPIPFELNGDVMTMGMGGQSIRLTRIGGAAAIGAMVPKAAAGRSGGVMPELAGKWCYQANVYATNGGARSSTQCITLNADGTYKYFGESDSYNPNGGATSNSWDEGTWTATETSITANSRVKGTTTTYRLEKRNHPKNVNDPMIVLDGQAFVTAYQKPPWR